MPGVPSGVCPGVNIAIPPKGVAPGVAEGVAPLPGVALGVALGVKSAGVTSAGVAPIALGSTGVSSHRTRLRFVGAPPGVGVSPNMPPGVGVSPNSSAGPPGVAPQPPPFFEGPSSSSSTMGVSAPSSSMRGVAHLSLPSSPLLFSASFFPAELSQRRFFFSAPSSPPPSALRVASSSFCFWIFRSTSAFSLSNCCPTITSL
mmetsp:Transcript_42486/g.74513  ORF Transcript_42486/g.74513 Transcript_42486/m.74513 type:complete len:202 (+) Transcript_42486:2991-3596(+)